MKSRYITKAELDARFLKFLRKKASAGAASSSGSSGSSSSSSSGGDVEITVAQTAHGFAVGDAIRCSGTNAYAKAQADTAADAEVVGVVSEVTDADNFKYKPIGIITSSNVPNVTAGQVLFLSAATAGLLTDTEPVTEGYVSKPVAVVLEAAGSMLVLTFRGVEISEGLGLLNDLDDVAVASPAAGQVLAYNSETGDWENMEIAGSAGAIKTYSVAGATPRNDNDTQKSTSATSPTKLKEIKLNEPMKGIRISFLLTASESGKPAYAQIYRNGAAIGTLRSTTEIAGETFTEDFNTLWAVNDLIQIYVYATSGGTAYIETMSFCYDRAIAACGSWHLVTYLPTVEQTAYSVTNQDP